MSVSILITRATVGGKTWQAAQQSIETDYPIFTFDDGADVRIMYLGAKTYTVDIVCNLISLCFDRIKTPHENHG